MQINWRKLLQKDLPVFVSFVLVATLLWWVRAMNTSRDTFIRVPVTYAGVGEDVQFSTTPVDMLTVQIHDTGRRIRMLKKENPHVELNLTNKLKYDNGSFNVPSDVLHHRVEDLLPGTTSLISIHPDHLDLDYYRQHHKTVPVVFRGQITPDDQYQIRQEPQLQPSRITIYGKEEDLAKVKQVETEPLNIDHLRDSLCQTVALVVPEQVRLEVEQVEVRCFGEQFTEKRFTLPIEVLGQPEGARLHLFPSSADVIVRIAVNDFASVDADDIHIYCHYPSHPTDQLPLTAQSHNAQVTHLRVSPSSVEYLIEK